MRMRISSIARGVRIELVEHTECAGGQALRESR